jgi:hypothetical protein
MARRVARLTEMEDTAMILARRSLATRVRAVEPYGTDLPAPAVNGLTARQSAAGVWVLTVSSAAAAPFHVYWLIDGELVAHTTGPQLTVRREATFSVEALISRHGDVDASRWQRMPRAGRLRVGWVRPLDEDVDEYRCELATGLAGDNWSTFATVRDDGRWSYQVWTPTLTDMTYYRFRVVPVVNGNAGTPLIYAARLVARVPNGPACAADYDPDTGKVTFV